MASSNARTSDVTSKDAKRVEDKKVVYRESISDASADLNDDSLAQRQCTLMTSISDELLQSTKVAHTSVAIVKEECCIGEELSMAQSDVINGARQAEGMLQTETAMQSSGDLLTFEAVDLTGMQVANLRVSKKVQEDMAVHVKQPEEVQLAKEQEEMQQHAVAEKCQQQAVLHRPDASLAASVANETHHKRQSETNRRTVACTAPNIKQREGRAAALETRPKTLVSNAVRAQSYTPAKTRPANVGAFKQQWPTRRRLDHSAELSAEQRELRRKEADEAFKLWLRRKMKQQRATSCDNSTAQSEIRKSVSETEKFQRKINADTAFQTWLQRKHQEKYVGNTPTSQKYENIRKQTTATKTTASPDPARRTKIAKQREVQLLKPLQAQ